MPAYSPHSILPLTRYEILLKTLDQLRAEAPAHYKSYHPASDNLDAVNAARSRAYIHLLLKVYFGLLTFESREELITDSGDDGGVDAYYIDTNRKKIYFIQSKFRTTQRNFEEKAIDAEELLCMDIDRITKGETSSEAGKPYNAKILAMARKIQNIHDISRYDYSVIILANAKGITRQKLGLLTGGFQPELIDHQAAYSKLLFPLITGTYYLADELHLSLSLSDKNAGSKISYSVQTEHAKIEITVVFVPTIEIAKAMYRYRNSILKYNPRSFLENEGKNVNAAIRDSIEKRTSNEFALFNNGITMLSDETYLNERIGQKGRAQLTLLNPQIINGGQTAYTLSQIYKERMTRDAVEIFGNKEVLVKIITFDSGSGLSEKQKLELIEAISKATNSQTVVTNADRRSNEVVLKQLQAKSFERLGILLERKRGEFSDGIREGYIDPLSVVDRNMFLRAALLAQDRFKEATAKKIAAICNYSDILEVSDNKFMQYRWALLVLRQLQIGNGNNMAAMRMDTIAKACVGLLTLRLAQSTRDISDSYIADVATDIGWGWKEFREFCVKRYSAVLGLDGKPPKPFDLTSFSISPSTREYLLDAINIFFLRNYPPPETGEAS